MELEFRTLIKSACPIVTNIDWGIAADNQSYPNIVMNLIYGSSTHSYKGKIPFNTTTIQVDVYATTMAQAVEIKNQILTLDGFRHGITIKSIFLDKLRQDVEVYGNTKIYRYSLDFNLTHS